MREDLIKEFLELKAQLLTLCKEIQSLDTNYEGMLKIVFEMVDSPENSESALQNKNDEELQNLVELFRTVLSKTKKTLENVNVALEKMNPPIVDKKKQKQELTKKAIQNRLLYFRYRILNFLGIEIK